MAPLSPISKFAPINALKPLESMIFVGAVRLKLVLPLGPVRMLQPLGLLCGPFRVIWYNFSNKILSFRRQALFRSYGAVI